MTVSPVLERPTTASTVDPPAATPVPTGSILLHVGPHKTGTTALQGALWTNREALLRQGVHLAAKSRNPANAVRAVTGQASPYSDKGRSPSIVRWQRLARAIRASHEPRVIVSSEFFAWAVGDAVKRIADDLGAERLQIAVTLRPLARVIPSMWQQNVQAGTVNTIDDWLQTVLEQSGDERRHSFWTLERHDELIDRWIEVVGADRVTAVVVDERDHGVLMRSFEQLLDLAPGTLVSPIDLMNRSFTLPEAEAVRAFNLAFKAKGLPRGRHARLMRFGAAQVMKHREPSPDERRVELPAWAVEPVDAIQRQMVEGIRRTGIRIVGDLDRLLEPAEAGATPPGAVQVSPEVAAAMAIGLVVAAGEARAGRGDGPMHFAEPVQVADVPTYQLVAVLVLRGRQWLSRTVDRFTTRVRRLLGRLRRLVRPRRRAAP